MIAQQYHPITHTFNTTHVEVRLTMINATIIKNQPLNWHIPLSLYIGNQEGEKYMRIMWLIITYLNDRITMNYFFHPMNRQINGGDPENIPGQAGKGFADSSLAYQRLTSYK